MDDPRTLLGFLALLLVAVWQGRAALRAATDRRLRRAALFDNLRHHLADRVERIEPDGFPRIAGTYRGARFDLRVVPDTLTVRKLPALWLLVTLAEPLPFAQAWHLMRRPRGTETFSTFDTLPRLLPPVPGLPHDTALRTDAPAGALPPAALAAALGRIDDERLKELVLAPRGLRVTWLAEEAHRGRYLLFRDGEMGREPLDSARILPLLDALLDLRDDLAPEPERRRA